LYGNIFAGENMLDSMASLVRGLGWLLPIPFYFMELLVGLVQAMVFMLLTAVFTLLLCAPEEQRPSGAHEGVTNAHGLTGFRTGGRRENDERVVICHRYRCSQR